MHPAPRHITEEELRVLEGCLHRWRSEVENDTRGMSVCLLMQFWLFLQGKLSVKKLHGPYVDILCDFLPHRSAGQYNQNPQNH